MSELTVGDSRLRSVFSVVSWSGVAAWMGAIFYMSSQTGIKVWNPMTYVAHFAEYVILGLLLCVALRISTTLETRSLLFVALAIASLYGLSDEIHQGFVPTRQVSGVDWAVDTLGAAGSVAFWSMVSRLREAARVR